MTHSACPDHQQLLLAADNRLDPAATALLQRHLEQCPRCRQELSALQTIHAALPAADWSCSAQDASRFAARISAAVRRPPTRRLIWQAPLAAAAIAGIALVLLPFSARQPDGGDPVPALQMEMAILADQDLLDNLELLQQLDLLEGLEESG